MPNLWPNEINLRQCSMRCNLNYFKFRKSVESWNDSNKFLGVRLNRDLMDSKILERLWVMILFDSQLWQSELIRFDSKWVEHKSARLKYFIPVESKIIFPYDLVIFKAECLSSMKSFTGKPCKLKWTSRAEFLEFSVIQTEAERRRREAEVIQSMENGLWSWYVCM